MAYTTTPDLIPQNGFSTTLATAITAADTVIYLNALPTATEGFLTIDEGLSTEEIIFYSTKGANFVTCPSATDGDGRGIASTSPVGHSSGAVVKMKTVAEYFKALQDGKSLLTGSITPEKLMSGTGALWTWSAYTPTFANTTLGNGTVSGAYKQIGKTVFFKASFVFGSTSAMGTTPTVTLPVTAAPMTADENMDAVCHIVDLSSGTKVGFAGPLFYLTTTTAEPSYLNANSISVPINSTSPMTWTTGDTLRIKGSYEAA